MNRTCHSENKGLFKIAFAVPLNLKLFSIYCFPGLKLAEAKEEVMKIAKRMKIGGYPVSSNLQDWLISRQR